MQQLCLLGVLGTLLGSAPAAAQQQWPGWSGKSGANGDPLIRRADVEAFCNWRGRSCRIAVVYTDRTSWDSMTRGSGWLFDNFNGFSGQLVISQGLVPDGHNADIAACADGSHDQDWRDFGALMVQRGRGDSIVRLGWEFNGTFTSWGATNTEKWKACYRRAASAIRATNPQVILDWTINSHGTPSDVCNGDSRNCYPGDDVVDIIGVDNYDQGPSVATYADFTRVAAAPDGLDWIFEFARSRNKRISVGEWGVAPASDYNQTGDNSFFVYWMYRWFLQHAPLLAYEAYFNHCGDGVGSNLYRPGDAGCASNPKSANMYRLLFGEGIGFGQ